MLLMIPSNWLVSKLRVTPGEPSTFLGVEMLAPAEVKSDTICLRSGLQAQWALFNISSPFVVY